MHGGGSPAAAQMTVRQLTDLENKKEMAKNSAELKLSHFLLSFLQRERNRNRSVLDHKVDVNLSP